MTCYRQKDGDLFGVLKTISIRFYDISTNNSYSSSNSGGYSSSSSSTCCGRRSGGAHMQCGGCPNQ